MSWRKGRSVGRLTDLYRWYRPPYRSFAFVRFFFLLPHRIYRCRRRYLVLGEITMQYLERPGKRATALRWLVDSVRRRQIMASPFRGGGF